MSAKDTPGVEPGGDLLSRYRLQDRIGEGDLGIVYQAEEISSGKVVAAKFLRTCRDRSRVAPVVEGLASLVGFEHTNLVPLLDVGKDGVPSLVYEHYQGATLARLLKKHERLAPAAALRIMKGVAGGLGALHSKGQGHGSLGIQNIILDRQGKAKLADVGWAALATLADADPSPTPSLDVIQKQELSDLGRLLFHMLVGEDPGAGVPDLSSHLADVPTGLIDLVQASVEGRYPDANALTVAIDSLVKDRAVGGRKTAYPPLAARVLESGTKPPPRTDGGESLDDYAPPDADEEARQRRSDVLRAVGAAGATKRPPKKLPGLKVDVGKREGQTLGQLILLTLLGTGLVGGLAFLSHEATKEAPPAPTEMTNTGGPRGTQPRNLGHETSEVPDGSDLNRLVRAIIEEPRAAKRVMLVQTLLQKHASDAPEVLARVLQGGNDRIRAHVLPFLEGLDRSGERRVKMLRFATGDEGPWPMMLSSSLARSGLQSVLEREFKTRTGVGADVAMAASTRGSPTLALPVESRLEQQFLGSKDAHPEVALERWIRAAGGAGSALARWAAGKLLERAPETLQRQAILGVLQGLDANPKLFESLRVSYERYGFGWDEDGDAAAATLVSLAGSDAALLAQAEASVKKVQGF